MVDPSVNQCLPLNSKGSDQKGETNTAETVPLQKRHQETESDENDNVYILKF